MPNQDNLQILREIDKLDKIGLDGVCAMLGEGLKDASGAFNKGVGLMPMQVAMYRYFFESTAGLTDNQDILAALEGALIHLDKVRTRIDLMALLEERVVDAETGKTLWDHLLNMAANTDQTWSNGGRPENVGWALDDLVKIIRTVIAQCKEAAASTLGSVDLV